jgi:hypothetical protein
MPTLNTDGSAPSALATGVTLVDDEFRPNVARALLRSDA